MSTVHNAFKPMPFSRRNFLLLSALASLGAISGCATNPVTGRPQLMLMSEEQEISIDQEHSPHQISADYGPVQDDNLSRYLQDTGQELAAASHRPDMPYTFQGVNAVYVNAYAFPGGTIGITRGILLDMDNEAELSALLGHELGHVNARHTAARMTRGMLTTAVLAGAGAFLLDQERYAPLVAGLGAIGAGALLAKYSRDNEREADELGLEYMVQNEYNPQGMIGLMDMLQQRSRQDPGLLEIMFATHPMSEERYETAKMQTEDKYAQEAKEYSVFKERYMDNTAVLRRQQDMIRELQKGQELMMEKKFPEAEEHLRAGLQKGPDDYAGLLMLSKCLQAQNKHEQAREMAQKAKEVYPEEPQAVLQSGMTALAADQPSRAYLELETYEDMLPGNPQTLFYRGQAQEKMQRKKQAADYYNRFLQHSTQGEQAEHAAQRLQEWGHI